METGNGDDGLNEAVTEMAEHKAFEGVEVDLATLAQATPVLGDAALEQIQRKDTGILVRLLTASRENADYRLELKKARWQTIEKAREAVRAIDECKMFGVDYTPIVDDIIAQSAGEHGALVSLVIEGLTHTSFSTNYQGNRKHWWQRNDNSSNRSPTSPLS